MSIKAKKAPLPAAPRPPRRPIETHQQSFRDHRGAAALMVFEAPVGQPLPPLYSFAFYATAPGATADALAAPELFAALTASAYARPDLFAFRVDVYFAPGAPVDACIAHYRGEKAVRGTYEAQVAASPAAAARGPAAALPGLVPSYLQTPSYCHHDVLFVCPGDWRAGDVLFVEFNPASADEYQPHPEDAPDVVAPARVQRLPVCPDPAIYDGAGTVPGKMYELSFVSAQNLSDTFTEALEQGWSS